jgi:hypothetical protein
MPRIDGTGPFGLGPRTGRGMGRCANPLYRKQDGVKKEESKQEKLELLKKEKDLIEKEIANLKDTK